MGSKVSGLSWMRIGVLSIFCIYACGPVTKEMPAGPAHSESRPAVSFSESITSLSRIEPNETFYPISLRVTEDSAHIAYAAKNPKGMLAAFDNQRGPYCKAVAKGTPLISQARLHWAYIALGEQQKAQAVVDLKPEALFDGVDAFAFSPDGSRWAYRAGTSGRQAVVVNGTVQTAYEIIDTRTGPLFSPDGKRLAYGALNGKTGYLVVNGTERSLDGTVESIVFSPDSKHLACAMKKGDQQWVVSDGQPGPMFKKVTQLTFSPDSRRFAYMALKESDWIAVLDGHEMVGGDGVGTPLFSTDGRHLAYAAHEGKDWYMVMDGKKGRIFEEIGISMFSPDNSRLAYMAQTKDRACMVVDDQMGPIYDAVGEPVFSPDSKQLAYRAKRGDKWLIVQNGRPHETSYDGLRRPVFSPDGRHLAYVAIQGKEMIMILDESPLSRHDSLSFPFFSPDSAHLAYAGCHQDIWRAYVDGTAGKNVFDAFLKDGIIVFDDEKNCHVIVLKLPGPEFLRLDIQIAGSTS